jgi:pyridoxamine 5'-phosphate oxidase
MTDELSLRQRLRALPVFPDALPYFDTDAAPADPLALLREWVETAIAAQVLQPHAMTLATATENGEPSARTLLLKDIDESSVWFASLSNGPKGANLAVNPRVALVLYWREQGRQIRIVGDAEPGPRDVSEADFLERKPQARARAIAGRQSEPVEDFDAHLAPATAQVESDPDFVPDEWVAYRVIPNSVEFWQAERKRDQVRLRYLATPDGWRRDMLWP